MHRKIQLLGILSIVDADQPSRLMSNAKGCALLAYLLVRGTPQSREHLADLFWDASSTADGLRNLRVLLTRTRPHLPGLAVTRKTLAYAPASGEHVDYLSLVDALPQDDAQALSAGLALYQGDLLHGFYLDDAPRFQEWLTVERERLRRVVLEAYRRLCRALEEAQRWQEGKETAARWLALDDLDEEAARWLMQFLAGGGQTPDALEAYAQLRWRLQQELDVEPEPATRALVEKLRDAYRQATAGLYGDLQLTVELVWPDPDTPAEPGLLPANSLLPFRRYPHFTGRAQELAQLGRMLLPWPDEPRTAAAPVAVVSGMAGLGKTQLAVEFAYRYGRYFAGGVFWLSFAEADNVPEEVAQLGCERGLKLYRDADQLTLAERIGRVQRAWQEPVPRLLIFDNCEDEALLANWLPVTGGCRVLVTSRRGTWARAMDVKCVPLNPLAPIESRRLLQRLAPHVTTDEAETIAAVVGHLPLALHLAGGFLHRYHEVDAVAYAHQLRGKALLHHPSLQGHGAGYSPTGHVLNVARTFALSWQQLDAADEIDNMARKLLARAACLAPGEPIPAAWLKSLINPHATDLLTSLLVEDGLSRLVAAGFLQTDKAQTVVLHRLLAVFTQEASGPDEMEEAQRDVAAHMAQTLSSIRRQQGHLSTLPFAVAHLRYVAESAMSTKKKHAANMATMLGFHLEDIGETVEAEQVLKRGSSIAQELGDATGQGHVLNALASTQESMGYAQASLRSAREAVVLFQRSAVPDPIGLAEAYYYQRWAHYRLGQIEEALRAANAGYALSQSENSQRTMAYCLNLIGVVHYYVLGRYDAARQKLEEGLSLHRAVGNRRGESVVLNNMGESARLQGDYTLAVECYEAALAIAREIKNHHKAILFLSNLCGARIRLGQYDTAASDLETLIAATHETWFGLSESCRFLAEAYLGQGRLSQAVTMGRRALELASELDPFEKGRAWRVLGLISTELGSAETNDPLPTASECFSRSMACFRNGDVQRDRAITLWYWARQELAHGNKRSGEPMWQEARDGFQRLNLPLLVAAMDGERR